MCSAFHLICCFLSFYVFCLLVICKTVSLNLDRSSFFLTSVIWSSRSLIFCSSFWSTHKPVLFDVWSLQPLNWPFFFFFFFSRFFFSFSPVILFVQPLTSNSTLSFDVFSLPAEGCITSNDGYIEVVNSSVGSKDSLPVFNLCLDCTCHKHWHPREHLSFIKMWLCAAYLFGDYI